MKIGNFCLPSSSFVNKFRLRKIYIRKTQNIKMVESSSAIELSHSESTEDLHWRILWDFFFDGVVYLLFSICQPGHLCIFFFTPHIHLRLIWVSTHRNKNTSGVMFLKVLKKMFNMNNEHMSIVSRTNDDQTVLILPIFYVIAVVAFTNFHHFANEFECNLFEQDVIRLRNSLWSNAGAFGSGGPNEDERNRFH